MTGIVHIATPGEVRSQAEAALREAAKQAGEVSPEQMLSVLLTTGETYLAMEAIACRPHGDWEEIVWRAMAERLARAYRRSLGLPVCAQDQCPHVAHVIERRGFTLALCDDHRNVLPP